MGVAVNYAWRIAGTIAMVHQPWWEYQQAQEPAALLTLPDASDLASNSEEPGWFYPIPLCSDHQQENPDSPPSLGLTADGPARSHSGALD